MENYDEIEEKQEAIEESLEDLLIFPTQKGLRRSVDMINSYFSLLGKQQDTAGRLQDRDYQSMMDDQQQIMDITRKELSGIRKFQAEPSGCDSCSWVQAPKPIDKGIDKNVAARLAFTFNFHVERFKELHSS